MPEEILRVGEAYYAAMNKKDVASMQRMLHPNVHFVGPLAELQGKEAVLKAISGFTAAFEKLEIREKFHAGNKVMLAIDTEFPEPTGQLRTASLLTIEEGLIAKIELFYDSRVVESKKEEIFAK